MGEFCLLQASLVCILEVLVVQLVLAYKLVPFLVLLKVLFCGQILGVLVVLRLDQSEIVIGIYITQVVVVLLGCILY
jgi:hypothetical protein